MQEKEARRYGWYIQTIFGNEAEIVRRRAESKKSISTALFSKKIVIRSRRIALISHDAEVLRGHQVKRGIRH